MSHKFFLYAPLVTASVPGASPSGALLEHWELNLKLHKQGVIHMGGALNSPDALGVAAVDRKVVTGVAIYNGDSLEAVRKLVESDVLYTSGVWDKERLVLLPFSEAPYQKY